MNIADDQCAILQRRFAQHFGRDAAWVAHAPGRVNLIGEHTDYNDGFVLPCAITMGTWVAIAPRQDNRVRVLALDVGGATDEFEVQHHRLGKPVETLASGHWANYVRGTVQMLHETLPQWASSGVDLGADIAITGNVPRGGGLSSSASLEVAVAQAFKAAFNLSALSGQAMARLAQRAEHEYAGCLCGIMDQLISACGQAGHALLMDCRSLATQAVPIPAGVAVMIVHSNVQRGLVDSEYNTRRKQCETAARHLGVKALRDASLPQLLAARLGLDEVSFRRARHVITENERTVQAADALAAGDLQRMGQLMAQSHASMQHDFEITTLAIDSLASLLREAIGHEGGARMTGGGFGGCVVALLPQARVAAATLAVQQHYRSPSGEPGTVWVCQAAQGASAVACTAPQI